MKIYATDNPLPVTPFDEYIGKDVFVKCWMFDDVVYARFLKKDLYITRRNDIIPMVVISYFEEDQIDNYVNPQSTECISDLGETCNVALSRISLYSPLEVIPIAELYGELPSRNILQNFIGTNIWVKAHTHYDCYINVISIEDDIVTYYWIDRSQIEKIESGDFLDKYDLEALDRVFTDTGDKFIDGVTVYEPLDLLTTDDIHEMIDSCPKADEPGDDE